MKTLNNLFQITEHCKREYRKNFSQWQRLDWIKECKFNYCYRGSDFKKSLAIYFKVRLIKGSLFTVHRKERDAHENYS